MEEIILPQVQIILLMPPALDISLQTHLMLEVVLMLQEKRASISPHHRRPKEVKRLSFPPNEIEIDHTSISNEKIVIDVPIFERRSNPIISGLSNVECI